MKRRLTPVPAPVDAAVQPPTTTTAEEPKTDMVLENVYLHIHHLLKLAMLMFSTRPELATHYLSIARSIASDSEIGIVFLVESSGTNPIDLGQLDMKLCLCCSTFLVPCVTCKVRLWQWEPFKPITLDKDCIDYDGVSNLDESQMKIEGNYNYEGHDNFECVDRDNWKTNKSRNSIEQETNIHQIPNASIMKRKKVELRYGEKALLYVCKICGTANVMASMRNDGDLGELDPQLVSDNVVEEPPLKKFKTSQDVNNGTSKPLHNRSLSRLDGAASISQSTVKSLSSSLPPSSNSTPSTLIQAPPATSKASKKKKGKTSVLKQLLKESSAPKNTEFSLASFLKPS